MNWISIFVTASAAVVGGIVTGLVLKAMERHHAISDSVRLELAKAFVLQHFEIVNNMKGEINELAHHLERAERSPHRFVPEDLVERAYSIRSLARSRVAILGEPAVSRIHKLTAQFIHLAEQAAAELRLGDRMSSDVTRGIGRLKDETYDWTPLAEDVPPVVAPDAPRLLAFTSTAVAYFLRMAGRRKRPVVSEALAKQDAVWQNDLRPTTSLKRMRGLTRAERHAREPEP